MDRHRLEARAVTFRAQIDRVDTSPTEGQKKAGNYAKGHVRVHGLPISIENPRGSHRVGMSPDGSTWRSRVPAHYGYIKRTEGADGDHVDVFVGPHRKSPLVYVIDQKDAASGDFDEHKIMLGFASNKHARNVYLQAFSDGKGKQRLGAMTEMTVNQLKHWLDTGNTRKPLHRAAGGSVAAGGMWSDEDEARRQLDERAKADNQKPWYTRAYEGVSDAAKRFAQYDRQFTEDVGSLFTDLTPVAKVIRKATGTVGDTAGAGTREQLWPEKMVRSGASLPGDVASGAEPMWQVDPVTGQVHTAEKAIERAQDTAGMAGGASAGASMERAAAGSGRDLRVFGRQVLASDSGKSGAPVAALAEQARPFFSAVERTVESIPQAKMTGDQWLGTLKNKPGVKPEEMDWIGLTDFLTERAGKPVTKAEIADHIAGSKVELNEVRKGNLEEPAVITEQDKAHFRDTGEWPWERGAEVPDWVMKDAGGSGKPLLPMNETTRMARAKEQGFTRDAYHGTQSPEFDKFKRKRNDVGIHFGTPEQANDRMNYMRDVGSRPEEGMRIMPVKLRVNNPLRLRDVGAWDEGNMRYALQEARTKDYKPVFTPEEIWGAKSLADMRDLIESKGYDGIVYKNTGEVAGSESYREVIRVAKSKMEEALGKGKNSFSVEDQKHPAYQEWSKAHRSYDRHREAMGEDSYIAFRPEQVRSRFAKFDPKKKGKSGLLLSDAAKTGAALSALEDDQMKRAAGGSVMSDAEFESAGAPVMSDADFEKAKPAEGGIMPSWTPRAVTDVPSEIYDAGAEAVSGMSNLVPGMRTREKEGFFEGPLKTGRGVLAIPEFVFSPLIGAARSLFGHPLAAVEDAGNRFNKKPVDEKASFKRAKGDVDLATMAARPRTPRAMQPLQPTPRAPGPPDTIGDFGVPLTEGEAAADFGKIATERRALRGGEGSKAQKVAEDFMAHRDEELSRARGDVSRSFDEAGGQQIAETPHEAAELAGEGVRRTAGNLKQVRDQRYAEMRELPGEFKPDAFKGVADEIKQTLSAGDSPVIIDTTTPIAARALADIEQNISRLRIPNAADPMGAPNPQDIVGINLKGVDQQRKRLVQFVNDTKGPMPTPDQRATRAIIEAFDEQVESAIMKGLFSGDPRALEALREARSMHSEYRRLFTSNGTGDDVGRVMQHIMGNNVREPATPTEIANYLYGATNVGAKGISFRVAERLKNVLGAQSPEWAGIKQGLFQKLTETPPGVTDWGPQKVANNIDKFLNGDGRALANRMFDPGQRELMQRYADLLRKTIPPPGAVNYSNNLQWATRMREGVQHWMMGLIGHHLGGTTGAVVGTVASLAGKPFVESAKAAKIAKSMPTIADSMKRWDKAILAASKSGQPNSTAVRAATTNLITRLKDVGMTEGALRQMMGSVPAGAEQEQQKP